MGTLALERLAPLFVLSIAYADPVPSWPSSFSAVFDEYTWFQGAAQMHRGSIAYSANAGNVSGAAVQVIRRTVSQLNPICNEVHVNRTTPCEQHARNGSRYLHWPVENECCLHCTAGCGPLEPGWPAALPHLYTGLRQVHGATCHTWLVQSGTPDRIGTEVGTGRLCELYDGGASFTGDNPFNWQVHPESYADVPTVAQLALPEACAQALRC